jgi:hypothetical protein
MIDPAAILLAACLAAPSDSPPPTRVARGTVAAFEIEHAAGPLRAKALRDGTSPILVRVNPLGDARHRVECFGVVEGEFDLVPYLEQADGRPPRDLAPIRVEVFTQLPPNPGTDLYGVPEPRLALEGGYRWLLAAVGLAWIAVPVAAIVRRRLRRVEAPPIVATAPEPTPLDRVRAILDEARGSPLDTAQRGRLELLLLKALRDAGGESGTIADAIARLRHDQRAAPVVREVERWLHAAGGESRRGDAIARLEQVAAPIRRGEGDAP